MFLLYVRHCKHAEDKTEFCEVRLHHVTLKRVDLFFLGGVCYSNTVSYLLHLRHDDNVLFPHYTTIICIDVPETESSVWREEMSIRD